MPTFISKVEYLAVEAVLVVLVVKDIHLALILPIVLDGLNLYTKR
jgi:hypothetical protein